MAPGACTVTIIHQQIVCLPNSVYHSLLCRMLTMKVSITKSSDIQVGEFAVQECVFSENVYYIERASMALQNHEILDANAVCPL